MIIAFRPRSEPRDLAKFDHRQLAGVVVGHALMFTLMPHSLGDDSASRTKPKSCGCATTNNESSCRPRSQITFASPRTRGSAAADMGHELKL